MPRIIIALVIVVILLVLLIPKCEPLMSKPKSSQISQMTQDIIANEKSLESYTSAKYQMSWLDPVSYEKIRELHRNNKFNERNIKSVFG